MASKPTVAFNELKIKTGFSLHELKSGNKNNQKTENDTVPQNEDEPITAEQVRTALFAFAENKQQDGAKQLYVTITKAGFDFTNETLQLSLSNETQREQLQNLKQELLDDIRSRLRSNKVNLEITLIKQEMQTKAYKPGDIFKSMAEKNPAIVELKKRFDLEIDY